MTTIVFSKLTRPLHVVKSTFRANTIASVRMFSSNSERVHLKSSIIIERQPVVYPLPLQLELDYLEYKETVKKEREALRDKLAQERYDDEIKIRALGKSKAQAKKQAKVDKEVKALKEQRKKEEEEPMEGEEAEEKKGPVHDDLGIPVPFPKNLPRITPHDETDNRHSAYRKLEESLFLLVKNKNKWEFPQLNYEEAKDKKNIRLTAERKIKLLGDEMHIYILGNSPFAYWKNDLKDAEKKQLSADVSKTFFFPAIYISGDIVKNDEDIQDYAWATREQLVEYLDKPFYDYIKFALTIPTHIIRSENTDINLYK